MRFDCGTESTAITDADDGSKCTATGDGANDVRSTCWDDDVGMMAFDVVDDCDDKDDVVDDDDEYDGDVSVM